MDKIKKYIIYIVLLIVFAIFTELIIAVGLNSSYKEIGSASDIPENVVIYQAEATTVNGRIRGLVKNEESNPVTSNYLKFEFFSERDVNMGSKYIELDKTKTEIPFEAFFKLENVAYYKIAFVNEKEPKGELEIEFFDREFSKSEIFWMALAALVVIK